MMFWVAKHHNQYDYHMVSTKGQTFTLIGNLEYLAGANTVAYCLAVK